MYEGYNDRRAPRDRIRKDVEHSWRHALAKEQPPTAPVYESHARVEASQVVTRKETSGPYRWQAAPSSTTTVQLDSVMNIPIIRTDSKRDEKTSGYSDGMGVAGADHRAREAARGRSERPDELSAPVINVQPGTTHASTRGETDQVDTAREESSDGPAIRGPVAMTSAPVKSSSDQPNGDREDVQSPRPVTSVEWQSMVRSLDDRECGDDSELNAIRNLAVQEASARVRDENLPRELADETATSADAHARAIATTTLSQAPRNSEQGRDAGDSTCKEFGDARFSIALGDKPREDVTREGSDVVVNFTPRVSIVTDGTAVVSTMCAERKNAYDVVPTTHTGAGDILPREKINICTVAIGDADDIRSTRRSVVDTVEGVGVRACATVTGTDVIATDKTGAMRSQVEMEASRNSQTQLFRQENEAGAPKMAAAAHMVAAASHSAAPECEAAPDRVFDRPSRPHRGTFGTFTGACSIDRLPVDEDATWRFGAGTGYDTGQFVIANSDAAVPVRGEMDGKECDIRAPSLEQPSHRPQSGPMRSIGGSVLGPDRLAQPHSANWRKNETRVAARSESVTDDRSTPTRFTMGEAPLQSRTMVPELRSSQGRQTPNALPLRKELSLY